MNAARNRRRERSATWTKVRAAPDYRAFLAAYLEESGASLSDLARACGFHRGFPGDVISGRRRLTAKSALAFEKAMKLPATGKRLFRCLVAREEPEVLPGADSAALGATIAELRAKTWVRVRKHLGASDDDSSLFSSPDAFAVFAAAGTAEAGATLATIQARTRLEEKAVAGAIEKLRGAGLLFEEGGVYRPQDTHVFLQTNGDAAAFTRLFQTTCATASARAEAAMKSDEELFLASSFCVDPARLPELKKALRKTLLQFIDESIDQDGGRVVRLVSSLFL